MKINETKKWRIPWMDLEKSKFELNHGYWIPELERAYLWMGVRGPRTIVKEAIVGIILHQLTTA
jgi:hypothetical protein